MSANFSLCAHLTQTVLCSALSIEACELELLHLLQHEFNVLPYNIFDYKNIRILGILKYHYYI